MDTVLGDYRLLEPIGEGAAGEVYLATPLRRKSFAEPGVPLAIKLYKPDILRQPRQHDRIKTEFVIGSQLAHPNLVRMHDYDATSPRPYLVMEYVDGITLDAWVRMFHPIPLRLTIHITAQLVSAVSELHTKDIIHRDVKPPNVMVSSSFDAKLMDFGVADVPRQPPEEKITPPDKFLGTIRNSSPELLHGLHMITAPTCIRSVRCFTSFSMETRSSLKSTSSHDS
jgi:serine/threonine protein kinase